VDKPAKKEYRQWAGEALGLSPLQVMSAAGFRQRGLTFTRLIGGVKQVVRFEIVVRPRYARDSAQLVILVDMSAPSADRIYAESMRGIPDARVPYFVRQDAETLRKPQRDLWLFANQGQAEALGEPLAEALAEDVIPYLACRSSIADFAGQCKSETLGSLQKHGPFATERPAYVASLISAAGSEDGARELLASAYPAGSRGRFIYEPVIEFYEHRAQKHGKVTS
jgi:hypothetical protein